MSLSTNNPFDLLGVEERFDLDEAALQRKYLQASAQSHPDRAIDPLQQIELARKAAAINQAYQSLKDPEARANALLAQLGGPAPSQNKQLPPGLLMEMMEIHERMEEALSSNDESELQQLDQWAKQQRDETFTQLTSLFQQAEQVSLSQPIFDDIRVLLNGLRYYMRMLEQLDADV